MKKLSAEVLDALGNDVEVPAYDRATVTPGIVHFGVGGFHRAHQAMYLDRLMSDGKALDWGIVGVGVLPQDRRMYDVLSAQDHLYTLVIKHPDGTLEPRVIGSIVDYLFAPDDREAVLARMVDPATRIVSLTITEGGYHVNQVTGELDASDPALAADLEPGATPGSAFGFIVEALRRRREAGVPPFTVMSCDNIPGNGHVARKMLVAFARLKDPALADWIAAEVRFPNCMVDRITPVTTDADRAALAERFGVEDGWPVVCEPFTQWVLEDDFGGVRPPYEDVGVQIVEDVEPYELMKLRLLNASHQALAYLGYLAGYRYAHEVCQDELFVEFLLGYMDNEGTPTLPAMPGVDLDRYKHQLIERFANPEVRDTLARLCAESSDRIPKWLLPVVREQLAAGREITRSVLVVASWARYAEAVDEQGEPIEVVDRLRDKLVERARHNREDPLVFISDPDLFGDLAADERFAAPYTAALKSLHEIGARATLEALSAESI
ncbi:mannitol dehydrogenase family protein [Kribbella solani]|uniref:mannitol dehydrogenase family protein n=1 Tax=Kribbella solani TaxID=236067 RepID=UPI0029AC4161|nr:mannitol dehydrogenase family protein [Kribbella solani]MDX3002584.1 mannitol dehydrogenase family protein [Kribbella solani]